MIQDLEETILLIGPMMLLIGAVLAAVIVSLSLIGRIAAAILDL